MRNPRNKPLIVTDCDEVLLHMVVPFRDWLLSAHGVRFDFATGGATFSMTRHGSGEAVTPAETWPLLRAFFATEMHRQYPIAGAVEAIGRLAEIADVVVLTNIREEERENRMAQLAAVGVPHRVICNQGGKGPALAKLVAEHDPSVVLFIDDIASNHESVAEHVPAAWRLQFIGEPELAVHIPASPFAHARIDDWASAETWLRDHALGVRRQPSPRPELPQCPNTLDPVAGPWFAWAMSIDEHLAKEAITLPKPAAPVASYVPAVEHGGLLHISGQLCFAPEGHLMVGRLGADRDLAFGQSAAERCALMLVAQMKAALGSLERVERIVKLGVFVNSDPAFTDQPKVANGASDMMERIFGQAGKHARAAVGVTVLPLGAAVEIDAIVAVKPA